MSTDFTPTTHALSSTPNSGEHRTKTLELLLQQLCHGPQLPSPGDMLYQFTYAR